MIDFLGAFPIVGMKRRSGSDDAVPNGILGVRRGDIAVRD